MIPQHLIDKALMAALGDLSGHHPIVRARWELTIEAALEAVVADIWDEGFEVGEFNGYAIGRDIETSEDTTNPYKRNEHA